MGDLRFLTTAFETRYVFRRLRSFVFSAAIGSSCGRGGYVLVCSRSIASYRNRSSKLTRFLKERRNWSRRKASHPVESIQPIQSSLPSQPIQPRQYRQPSHSSRPSQPSHSSQSSQPSHTSNTCRPSQPSVCRKSSQPSKSRQPSHSSRSS